MRLISDVMQSILAPGMRAPTRPARDSWTLLALGAVLLPLGGCKPSSATSQSPAADLDDIVAIESELAVNAERLEAQGVRLARVTEAKAEQAVGGGKISNAAGEADAAGAPPPPASPTEPEPEPVVAAESESDEDFAPASAPAHDSSVGISRSSRKAETNRSRRKPTRCERVCDLAEATCTLADRICELADEHVDDVRYEDACDRAQSQCEAASDACSACED